MSDSCQTVFDKNLNLKRKRTYLLSNDSDSDNNSSVWLLEENLKLIKENEYLREMLKSHKDTIASKKETIKSKDIIISFLNTKNNKNYDSLSDNSDYDPDRLFIFQNKKRKINNEKNNRRSKRKRISTSIFEPKMYGKTHDDTILIEVFNKQKNNILKIKDGRKARAEFLKIPGHKVEDWVHFSRKYRTKKLISTSSCTDNQFVKKEEIPSLSIILEMIELTKKKYSFDELNHHSRFKKNLLLTIEDEDYFPTNIGPTTLTKCWNIFKNPPFAKIDSTSTNTLFIENCSLEKPLSNEQVLSDSNNEEHPDFPKAYFSSDIDSIPDTKIKKYLSEEYKLTNKGFINSEVKEYLDDPYNLSNKERSNRKSISCVIDNKNE